MKAAQQLKRSIIAQLEIGLAAHLPAAPPRTLQQKHIVRIEVRSDAGAGRRVAHHQVVQAGEPDESKSVEQCARSRDEMVDVLHQQRPSARGQAAKKRVSEWTMLDLPAPPAADHYAGGSVLTARELDQFGSAAQSGK